MKLLKCILGANDCFKEGQFIVPKGVMIHSTGANNPTLRRYVQPLPGYADYSDLMEKLGKNPNGNDWNRPGVNACVHGFIGKLKDGSVAAVQTLPWNMRGWHAGRGTTRPSANNTHISFEICEDGLTDPNYFETVYREAVELTAYLCKMYDLDPLAPEVVICHSEGCRLGMASNHGDVMHWFPKHGKTMDDFRTDVAAATKNTEEEETEVRYKKLTDIPDKWNFRKIIDMLMTAGIIAGDGSDPDGNGDVIDLSHDMVRLIIFDYRAGVYDDAIRAAGLEPGMYR